MLAIRSMSKSLIVLALALTVAGLFIHGAAKAAAPFSGLAGKWTGDGSIVLAKRTTERMRCDATYVVSQGGEKVDLTLRCVSDSYHFDLNIGLVDTAGAVLGTWREPTQSVEGGISGTASGDRIQVTARGQNFAAAINLATRGAAQTVQISAPSGDLSRVAITLHHAR